MHSWMLADLTFSLPIEYVTSVQCWNERCQVFLAYFRFIFYGTNEQGRADVSFNFSSFDLLGEYMHAFMCRWQTGTEHHFLGNYPSPRKFSPALLIGGAPYILSAPCGARVRSTQRCYIVAITSRTHREGKSRSLVNRLQAGHDIFDSTHIHEICDKKISVCSPLQNGLGAWVQNNA